LETWKRSPEGEEEEESDAKTKTMAAKGGLDLRRCPFFGKSKRGRSDGEEIQHDIAMHASMPPAVLAWLAARVAPRRQRRQQPGAADETRPAHRRRRRGAAAPEPRV
jgi:hypothetical protein